MKQDGDKKKDGENTGQQPAIEQDLEDTTQSTSAGESQFTSNNADTENTTHSGPNDIDMDVAGTAFYEWQIELVPYSCSVWV